MLRCQIGQVRKPARMVVSHKLQQFGRACHMDLNNATVDGFSPTAYVCLASNVCLAWNLIRLASQFCHSGALDLPHTSDADAELVGHLTDMMESRRWHRMPLYLVAGRCWWSSRCTFRATSMSIPHLFVCEFLTICSRVDAIAVAQDVTFERVQCLQQQV
jgi:hypothetical protein